MKQTNTINPYTRLFRPDYLVAILWIPAYLLLTPLQAQIRIARKQMELYRYSDAILSLQKELKKKDKATHGEAMLLMSECYQKQNKPEMAVIWLELTLQTSNNEVQNAGILFQYASTLRTLGRYGEARTLFLRYDSLKGSAGGGEGKRLAALCDSGVLWSAAPPGYDIQPASRLNSAASEFSVIRFGEGFIFTSDRLNGKVRGVTYGWTGNGYLRQFYFDPASDANGCRSGDPLPAPIPGLRAGHQGPVFHCPECGILLATTSTTYKDRGKREPGKPRTHLLKMYSLKRHEEGWSRPEPFFLNNENFSVGHAALTPALDTLFFISDMPGGYGGTDIYMCLRNGDKWFPPVNLGPEINTSGNEMFPFAGWTGLLFFASDGLPGLGGLDIFTVRASGGEWTIPANDVVPVNSSFDDFAVTTWFGDTTGWFSSNRPEGEGGDDIYCFRKIIRAPASATPSEPKAPVVSPAMPPVVTGPEPPTLPPHLEYNKNYTLENILYDFDHWEIRDDAVPALDSLLRIMKAYPVMVELSSHTDCRGSDEYNLWLSHKRAESAVRYLVDRGIESSRLTVKGFGETRPVNACNCRQPDSCTEEEHQQNRRTEFFIRK